MHPYAPSAHQLFLTSQFSAFLDLSSCSGLVLWDFPIFPAAVTSRHTRVSVQSPELPVPGQSHQTPSWCWTWSHRSVWMLAPVFPPPVFPVRYSHHWYSHHQHSHRAAEAFPGSAEFYTITQYLFFLLFDSRNGFFVSTPSPPAPKSPRNPTLDFGSFVPNRNLSRLRFPAPPTLGKKGE